MIWWLIKMSNHLSEILRTFFVWNLKWNIIYSPKFLWWGHIKASLLSFHCKYVFTLPLSAWANAWANTNSIDMEQGAAFMWQHYRKFQWNKVSILLESHRYSNTPYSYLHKLSNMLGIGSCTLINFSIALLYFALWFLMYLSWVPTIST